MFFLTLPRKLYKILSSNSSPAAIGFGVAFGTVAGCVPVFSGLMFLMLLMVLIFRVQTSTALFAWGITRLASKAFLARAFEGLGESLLEAEALKGFWTFFLNLPVVAWLGLDRYAIMGGAVVGVLLGIMLFFAVRHLVVAYRRFLHEKVSTNRFFRWFTNFWIIKVLRFVFIGAARI